MAACRTAVASPSRRATITPFTRVTPARTSACARRAARAPSRIAAAARPTRRSPWRAHWPRRSPRRSASGLRRAACRSRPTGWSVAPTMKSSSSPAVKSLARGGAAQHDHLAGEQRAARLDLGHGAALQPRALEHDGLLRQPFQGRPLGDAHRDIDGAMAAALGGPVDLLGRLGGGDGRGARPDLDRHFEGIAVGDPARGGQMHGLRRFAGLRTEGTKPGRDRVDRGRPAASGRPAGRRRHGFRRRRAAGGVGLVVIGPPLIEQEPK